MYEKSFEDLVYKKRMTYSEYAKLANWGRKYPVRFVENVLGYPLTDIQRYLFYNMWGAKQIALLCCRSFGKTTLIALYLAARNLLFPNYKTYILSKIGPQAKNTLKKIEDIANNDIASFTTGTNVLKDEIKEIKRTDASNWISFYNNSTISTLNSDPDNIFGYRANCVCYDEAGSILPAIYTSSEPFVATAHDFSIDPKPWITPERPENQLIYIGSANGGTHSHFFKVLRNTYLNMIQGDTSYFCCDIDYNVIEKYTSHDGEFLNPVVSRKDVNKALEDD